MKRLKKIFSLLFAVVSGILTIASCNKFLVPIIDMMDFVFTIVLALTTIAHIKIYLKEE